MTASNRSQATATGGALLTRADFERVLRLIELVATSKGRTLEACQLAAILGRDLPAQQLMLVQVVDELG